MLLEVKVDLVFDLGSVLESDDLLVHDVDVGCGVSPLLCLNSFTVSEPSRAKFTAGVDNLPLPCNLGYALGEVSGATRMLEHGHDGVQSA